jgi:hypothetical protein
MKVISKPDYTTWTYGFTCGTCKSELIADHNDLKHRIEKRWVSDSYDDGGDYEKTDVFYLTCPVCSVEKEVSDEVIPYLLQTKLRKK